MDFLSVACIFRDTRPNYLNEWLEYHRCMGVDTFYLYDDGTTEYDIRSEIDLRNVTLIPYESEDFLSGQLSAYVDALSRTQDRSTWLALIDDDEFLVPVKHGTMYELLKDYDKESALILNWMPYGGNSETPVESRLRQFSKRATVAHTDCVYYKTILKPQAAARVVNPHQAEYQFGKYAVDLNRNKIYTATHHSQEEVILGVGRINHYFTGSREDWLKKCLRKERNYGRSYDRNLYEKYLKACNIEDLTAWHLYQKAQF